MTLRWVWASHWARDSHTARPEPRSAAQPNQPDRGVETITVFAALRSNRAIRLKAGRRDAPPPVPSITRVAVWPFSAAVMNGPASFGANRATGRSIAGRCVETFSAIASPVGPVVTSTMPAAPRRTASARGCATCGSARPAQRLYGRRMRAMAPLRSPASARRSGAVRPCDPVGATMAWGITVVWVSPAVNVACLTSKKGVSNTWRRQA